MTIAMRAAASLGALLVLGGSSNSVLLRYHFRPNQELRYRLRLSMQTQAAVEGKLQLVAPVNTGEGVWKLRTVSLHKDGSAVVSSAVTGLAMRMGAGAVADPETVTFTLTPTGHITQVRTPYSHVPAGTRTFRDLAAIARISTSLPQGRVHAGSTWTSWMPSPAWGARSILIRGRVKGISGPEGRRVAVLEQRFQFPIRLTLPDQSDGRSATEWDARGIISVVSTTRFSVQMGIPVATYVEARGIVRVSPRGGTQGAQNDTNAPRLHILVRASTQLEH